MTTSVRIGTSAIALHIQMWCAWRLPPFFCVNKNTINTALYTSGKDVQDKADCIVGVYCDWAYNSNLIVRVYSHWVYTAKCIVGVYRDWVYNASSGCTGIVGIYSDWVYNAKCVVGTRHVLISKPVVLWVHNASYTDYLVGVIHCECFRKPRQQRHSCWFAKHCGPLYCTVAVALACFMNLYLHILVLTEILVVIQTRKHYFLAYLLMAVGYSNHGLVNWIRAMAEAEVVVIIG